jgi:hypothetical protein
MNSGEMKEIVDSLAPFKKILRASRQSSWGLEYSRRRKIRQVILRIHQSSEISLIQGKELTEGTGKREF